MVIIEAGERRGGWVPTARPTLKGLNSRAQEQRATALGVSRVDFKLWSYSLVVSSDLGCE